MTAYVIDPSLMIAALVTERDSAAAEAALLEARVQGAFAPAHLPYEVSNGLLMKERRGDIDRDYKMRALDRFLAYGTVLDAPRDRTELLSRTMDLAERHGLTIYDAAYLELAVREGYVLGSLDGPLRRAARAEGVAVAPT